MIRITAFLLSALSALSVCALDEIEVGKDYKGQELEVEGDFVQFFSNFKQGINTLHIKSSPTIKFECILRRGLDIPYASMKSGVKIKVKGRCRGSDMSSFNNTPVMNVWIDVSSYELIDTGRPKPNIPSVFDEKTAMKSIITVKGAKGSGSGFIVNYKGGKYLATNIHVIFDDNPQFLTPSNEKIEVSNPLLAPDRDIALFKLPDDSPLPALEVEEDLEKIEIAWMAVVYGNSLGGGVNTRLTGRIVEIIDKQNIEINIPIVPGNSGSPIISTRNGKVLGISTYLICERQNFSKDKKNCEERVSRFGMRLDTADISSFQPFDRQKYAKDVKTHNSVVAMNELAAIILSDIYEYDASGALNPFVELSRYDFKKYPSLKAALTDWNDIVASKSAKGSKRAKDIETAMTRFKTQISAPISSVKNSPVYYKWIKISIDQQLKINKHYCEVFDEIRQEVEATHK